MKNIIGIVLLLFPFTLLAQSLQTHKVFAVYDGNKLLKVYSAAEDCVKFVSNSKTTLNQKDIDVYYTPNTVQWYKPCADTFDDVFQPKPLDDKFLVKDSIYVVKQRNFYFALRAYLNEDECKSFAKDYNNGVYDKVPYFYRDDKSCELAKGRRNKRLQR